jgi:hypothetical protein
MASMAKATVNNSSFFMGVPSVVRPHEPLTAETRWRLIRYPGIRAATIGQGSHWLRAARAAGSPRRCVTRGETI